MNWFRCYTDINWDRKLRRHPPAIRWAWITILCIARRSPQPGYLLIGNNVPMTAEDLADEAAISIDEAEEAIRLFQDDNHRMLNNINGILFVSNWGKRQMESDSSTERVRRYRQKQQSETLQSRFSNDTETAPDTETDPEKDQVVVDQNKTPLSPQTQVQNDFSTVIKAYEAQTGFTISPAEAENLQVWHDQDGMPAEIIIAAIKEAVRQGKRTAAYIDGILRDWSRKGIKTLAAVATAKQEWENSKARDKPALGGIRNNTKVVNLNGGNNASRGDPTGDPIPISKLIIRADSDLSGMQTGD